MQSKFKIAKEFNKIIAKACEDQPLEDFLEDEIEYDCSGLDFDDTARLYDEYQDECIEWFNYFFEKTDMSPLEFCKACDWDYILDEENDRCLVMDSDKNKFLLVASMFEHYCIEIYNNLDAYQLNK